MPYNFLERAGTPPWEWFVAPDGLGIDATHSPINRGGSGTITISVRNLRNEPSDADPVGGSTVTVTDAIPTGLNPVSASGTGCTCTGTRTRTCTRNDTLAPLASYPPITIAVTATDTAPYVVTNTPKYVAHGQSWANTDPDPISIGQATTGDVAGTVPATLALSVGSASFGAFTPGVAKTYTATAAANVISTAGDATLSVSDPGNLTNGAFSLPSPLGVAFSKSSWSAPTSNEAVTITFTQAIGAGDALRTGSYSKTLTFTLSTTTP